MQSKLLQIRDAMLRVHENVGHYEALRAEPPYIVWAEDSEYSSVEGDNYKLEQAVQGTIDLFTKVEYDALIDAVQEELKAARISFYLNSVQYEDETGYIHYEWVWTI